VRAGDGGGRVSQRMDLSNNKSSRVIQRDGCCLEGREGSFDSAALKGGRTVRRIALASNRMEKEKESGIYTEK
jgi:hypothetical protein